MARAVATVGVSVVARTKKFRKGMRGAQSSLKRFSNSVKRMSSRLVKYGAVLTGVAAGATALMVKRSFAAIDATAKWSDKLGIATDKLVGLAHAAKLTGVNVQTFQMGLQRMTRRLAEAAMGTGEAKAALKELGIDAKEMSRRGPSAALLAIADAMTRVKNQSDRVRLSFKLFDSEGVALVNMLRLGSKGLKEMMERAKELGLTFSRFSAAKIEVANNAITDLKAAFTGLANTLAITVAPAVHNLSVVATDFIVDFHDNFIEGIGSAIDFGIKSIGFFVEKLFLARAELKLWLAGMKLASADAFAFFGATGSASALREDAAKLIAAAAALQIKGRDFPDEFRKRMEEAMNSFTAKVRNSLRGGGFPSALGGDKTAAALANSFKQIDFTKIAIGRGGQKKRQPVIEKNSEQTLSTLRQILAVNRGGVFGVFSP